MVRMKKEVMSIIKGTSMVSHRRFFLPPLRRVSVVALEPLEIDCSIPLSLTAYISLSILEISDRPIDGSLVIKP